jgi:hypothetical protein
MTFQKGNRGNPGGRPKGAKNKLATEVLRDLIAIWNEPQMIGDKPMLDGDGVVITRGVATLRIMSKQRPTEFCKLYANLMPREFWVDQGVGELGDQEIDDLITTMRERVRLLREQKTEMIDITPGTKVLTDASEGRA